MQLALVLVNVVVVIFVVVISVVVVVVVKVVAVVAAAAVAAVRIFFFGFVYSLASSPSFSSVLSIESAKVDYPFGHCPLKKSTSH
jgi:hypothetical protein